MPLLIEATINDVVHRVSTDSVALTHYWLPYVISCDAPNFDATKDYGGFCEITFGSISFHPDLFSNDWFPPDKIQLDIKYTESTEAAAVVVFLAVAYLSKVDNDSVSYDIRNEEYDKQILTECVDYDGNENIPVPYIIGTIQHAEPVRIADLPAIPRYRIDGIALDNPEIQISGIAFEDTSHTRITTYLAHGFNIGDSVIISDTKDFNGTYVVSWVSAYTFLIEKAFNPGVPLYQIASFEEHPTVDNFVNTSFEDWSGATSEYSGSFYPGVSGDDGYGHLTNFERANDQIQIGDRWSDDNNICFVRFQNVTIPIGATVTNAYIKLTSAVTEDKIVNVKIYANDVDDAVAPTTPIELMALDKTTAFSEWEPDSTWTDGVQYNTSDISSVIQEIIDRSGWATGQAIQILFVEYDSTTGNYKKASSIDYNSGSEKAELYIEWGFNNICDNWSFETVGTADIVEDTSIVHDGTSSLKMTFGAYSDNATISQAVDMDVAFFVYLICEISLWVYWNGAQPVLVYTTSSTGYTGTITTYIYPTDQWQEVTINLDIWAQSSALTTSTIGLGFFPLSVDADLYVDGPISITKAKNEYTKVTLDGSYNPFYYDPNCRVIGTTNYDGQYTAFASITSPPTFVIQKSYTAEVLDGVSEKAYVYTNAVTSLNVTGHVVDALTATPFRLYDDGVPITDNYIAVTSTFQSFALEAEPVGKLTISGTGTLTTFDDVLDAAATIAGITYDNTSARVVSPEIADIINTQSTIINYISAICEFYTHVAYVLNSVLYAIDCKRVNQANPTGISLSEHEFFDVNYYGKFSLSEIKSEWTVQRMTVHSVGDSIYVLETVDRIARSNLTLVSSGTVTDISTLKLMDGAATFIADGVLADMFAKNFDTGEMAQVTTINSETQLTLDEDIFSILATTEWETGVVWATGIVWGFNDLPEYIVGSMFSSGDDISVESYHQEVENVQLALYDIQSILVSYKIEVSLPMNALKWILPGDMLKFTDTKKPQDLDVEMKVKSLKYDFDNYTLIATGEGTIS